MRPPERGGLGFDAVWNDDLHHALRVALIGDRHGYYLDYDGVGDLAHALARRWLFIGRYSPYRGRRHGRPADDVSPSRFVVFTSNHDHVGNTPAGARPPYDDRQRLVAAAAVLLSPFTPMLFMGEEYAEPAPFPFFVDHDDPGLLEATRQGRRREFRDEWTEDVADPGARRRSTVPSSTRRRRDVAAPGGAGGVHRPARPAPPPPASCTATPSRTSRSYGDAIVLARARDGDRAVVVLAFGEGPATVPVPADLTFAFDAATYCRRRLPTHVASRRRSTVEGPARCCSSAADEHDRRERLERRVDGERAGHRRGRRRARGVHSPGGNSITAPGGRWPGRGTIVTSRGAPSDRGGRTRSTRPATAARRSRRPTSTARSRRASTTALGGGRRRLGPRRPPVERRRPRDEGVELGVLGSARLSGSTSTCRNASVPWYTSATPGAVTRATSIASAAARAGRSTAGGRDDGLPRERHTGEPCDAGLVGLVGLRPRRAHPASRAALTRNAANRSTSSPGVVNTVCRASHCVAASTSTTPPGPAAHSTTLLPLPRDRRQHEPAGPHVRRAGDVVGRAGEQRRGQDPAVPAWWWCSEATASDASSGTGCPPTSASDASGR